MGHLRSREYRKRIRKARGGVHRCGWDPGTRLVTRDGGRRLSSLVPIPPRCSGNETMNETLELEYAMVCAYIYVVTLYKYYNKS